jgi:nucleotide-binding universal stress UspA family protein
VKIILAVDGSRSSRNAVEFLMKLPFAGPPDVVVLHSVEPEPLSDDPLFQPLSGAYIRALQEETERRIERGKKLIARVAGRLAIRWKGPKSILDKGSAAERIIERAREEKADLILLGSHGFGRVEGFLLGSVSQKVATYAPCSVLVVKGKARGFKKILVADDGSTHSAQAIDFLKSKFSLADAAVEGIFLWEYPRRLLPKGKVGAMESRFQARMNQEGLKRPLLFAAGPAAQNIIETAKRRRADLVVVGSRGLTGLKRFLLGGVSFKVMLQSPCSVLVVRGPRSNVLLI